MSCRYPREYEQNESVSSTNPTDIWDNLVSFPPTFHPEVSEYIHLGNESNGANSQSLNIVIKDDDDHVTSTSYIFDDLTHESIEEILNSFTAQNPNEHDQEANVEEAHNVIDYSLQHKMPNAAQDDPVDKNDPLKTSFDWRMNEAGHSSRAIASTSTGRTGSPIMFPTSLLLASDDSDDLSSDDASKIFLRLLAEQDTNDKQIVDLKMNPTFEGIVDLEMNPASKEIINLEMNPASVEIFDLKMNPAPQQMFDLKMNQASEEIVDLEMNSVPNKVENKSKDNTTVEKTNLSPAKIEERIQNYLKEFGWLEDIEAAIQADEEVMQGEQLKKVGTKVAHIEDTPNDVKKPKLVEYEPEDGETLKKKMHDVANAAQEETTEDDVDDPTYDDTDEYSSGGSDESTFGDTDEPSSDDTDEPSSDGTDEPSSDDTDESTYYETKKAPQSGSVRNKSLIKSKNVQGIKNLRRSTRPRTIRMDHFK